MNDTDHEIPGRNGLAANQSIKGSSSVKTESEYPKNFPNQKILPDESGRM